MRCLTLLSVAASLGMAVAFVPGAVLPRMARSRPNVRVSAADDDTPTDLLSFVAMISEKYGDGKGGKAKSKAAPKKAAPAAKAEKAAAPAKAEKAAPPAKAAKAAPAADPVAVDQGGNLQKVILRSGSSEVELYTLGACVTSFKVDGYDSLFVRPDAKLDGSKPISGGLPHCFPQFGPGAMQQHGFGRNLDWAIDSIEGGEGDADPSVTLMLQESEETMGMWPYAFTMKYTVTLEDGGKKLSTRVVVDNTGDVNMEFQAALHSYFRCGNVNDIKVTSPAIKGSNKHDRMADTKGPCEESELTITKETDTILYGVSGDLELVEEKAGRKLLISNKAGWKDTVVWNPYGDAGMGADNFVCVESALVEKPAYVKPGASWVGEMSLTPSKL